MVATIVGTPTASTTTSVTLPAHGRGQVIVIFAWVDGSTTVPTKPAAGGTVPNFTDIDAPTGANLCAARTAWCIASATNHTSGTWTGATGMVAVVADTVNNIGGHALSGSTGLNTASAPAVTLSKSDGTSLLLEFYGHKTVTAWSAAPAGYTRQVSNATEVCCNTKDDTTTDGAIAQANTASSAGYMGATVELLATPKMGTFSDDFSTQDSTRWFYTAGASATAGQFVITPTTAYPNAFATHPYDLTGSYVFYQLVQPPNLGTGTIGNDLQLILAPGYLLDISWFAGNIVCQEQVASVQDNVSIPYNAAAHKWLQIRATPDGATVYWESSPTGIPGSWTVLRSKTPGIAINNLSPELACGYYGTEPSPGQLIADNFNVPQPGGGQFFPMF